MRSLDTGVGGPLGEFRDREAAPGKAGALSG